MAEYLKPAIDLLLVGGPVVWLLIAMSVLLASLALLKLLQFARQGLLSGKSRKLADQLLDRPVSELDTRRSPRGELAAQVLRARQLAQDSALDDTALTDELSRRANAAIHALRSHLRSIELIASLSPLIGLFGTVLGMIQSFRAMEAAGRQVDPSVLSGGIWVALLTTAVGLMVAIPASVIHNWLERRIDLFTHDLQDLLGRLLTARRAGGASAAEHSAEPVHLVRKDAAPC
ncbi:MotA/TolQ/ExbB proton channel family protein [Granulosicoccaceae sp. 1_MG-2023]|nr:MotA/TolQ/ExbB proton channel family protein [Granulosicoccaceae sp. 1_MG-2023]